MLKKYNQVFFTFLILLDFFSISLAWFLAYLFRFESGFIEVTKDIPSWGQHLPLLVIILLVCGVIFNAAGLYRTKRLSSLPGEIFDLIKAMTIAILIFVFLTYFFKEYRYSRLTILYFWFLSILFIGLSRSYARGFLKSLRKKGFNLRYVLILGEEDLGQKLIQSFHGHPELGLKAIGFLSDSREKVGQIIEGVQVLGTHEDLHQVLKKGGIDQVFIALPFHHHGKIKDILASLKNELVNIKVVSDLYDFVTLRGGVEELDGLPIINIQDTPLQGWGKIAKRMLDMILSVGGLLILSPLMGLIAGFIRLTSPGPILFKQGRMGFDGKIFEMLKFRSMVVDAERETGSVWARPNDPRRTPLGKILRKTSLDELPQLFNVLKGEMSLVGPRPERPELIQKFKDNIPNYMLRHKIKAGMTGWAQVNGWRGNTSLEKRIEHDLYYIENWSLSFDLRILFMTLWRGLISKQAY
ncbi:MAG: undecaprenyl-phosphate glucose phosphotransferase [Deltaproteobacteria bacterium RBG_16_48_10]|nr:MAG: undecaprenyl-phosphate glucose phosphotransferase [Deltaproteobacteria bacterium RBG_16_48_10]